MTDYVYRRYLYIDTDEVMAYATVMDGGEISDDVRTITRQKGGKIGAALGPKLIPFNLSIGANVDRSISKQFKVRQTAYTATDKVIKEIKRDKTGNGIKEGDIREGMVIECDVFLEGLLKVPEEKQVKPRNWRERRQEAKDPRIAYAREYSYHQDVAVEALSIKRGGTNTVLILALSPQWLLRPEEFSRRATIVGKVVGVRRDGETTEPGGNGTLDFKMPDNKTQDVAQQGSDSPSQPDGDGRWWWPWRSSSQHARDVATAAIPPRETPETGTPEPSRATIRIVPVVIYK